MSLRHRTSAGLSDSSHSREVMVTIPVDGRQAPLLVVWPCPPVHLRLLQVRHASQQLVDVVRLQIGTPCTPIAVSAGSETRCKQPTMVHLDNAR